MDTLELEKVYQKAPFRSERLITGAVGADPIADLATERDRENVLTNRECKQREQEAFGKSEQNKPGMVNRRRSVSAFCMRYPGRVGNPCHFYRSPSFRGFPGAQPTVASRNHRRFNFDSFESRSRINYPAKFSAAVLSTMIARPGRHNISVALWRSKTYRPFTYECTKAELMYKYWQQAGSLLVHPNTKKRLD